MPQAVKPICNQHYRRASFRASVENEIVSSCPGEHFLYLRLKITSVTQDRRQEFRALPRPRSSRISAWGSSPSAKSDSRTMSPSGPTNRSRASPSHDGLATSELLQWVVPTVVISHFFLVSTMDQSEAAEDIVPVFVLGCQPLDPASLNASDEVAHESQRQPVNLSRSLIPFYPSFQQIRFCSSMPRGLGTRRAPALTLIRPQFVATRHDTKKLAPPSHGWLPVPRFAFRESGIRVRSASMSS